MRLSRFPFLCLLVPVVAATSELIVDIEPGTGPVLLSHPAQRTDSSGQLGIADVAAQAQPFEPNLREVPIQPPGDGAVWYRAVLRNLTARPRELLLEVDNPLLGDVRLYERDETTWSGRSSGSAVAFLEREERTRTPVFRLRLAPRSDAVLYLRVHAVLGGRVPLRLWNAEDFALHERHSHLVMGGFYGALGFLVVYYLIVYFALRDRSYLYFVLSAASGILGWAAQNGLAFEFLWPAHPQWTAPMVVVLLSVGNVITLRFAQAFLATHEPTPRIHHLMSGLAWTMVGGGASLVVLSTSTAFSILNGLSLLIVPLWFWAGWARWKQGYRPAAYFLLASTSIAVGGVLFALMTAGWLPATLITVYGMQIGWIISSGLFALGLADRMRLLREDKERHELEALQNGLRLQLVDAENRRRSDELERARRLQTRFLPDDPPSVPFLDVACHQSTASEVGGDYYDFLHVRDDGMTGVIADATGHGVSAGLMIACTKTALLSVNGGAGDLPQTVSRLNTVLYRVNPESRMNMALLLYTVEVGPRGGLQLRLSGGGIPPAYIVRAAGAVEEIAVAGLPLGAVPDAEYRIRTAHLSTGDTVLLMSDGLPERLSPENEQLGYEAVERWLRLELDRQWPAATIVERLLDLGAAWSQEGVADDDETFVVMKVL